MKKTIVKAISYFFCIYTITFSFQSCRTPINSENNKTEGGGAKAIPVYVTTAKAEVKTFYNELWCNGKVEAGQAATLNFEQPGIVKEVLIRNGQEVKRGDILVRLDDSQQRLALQKAEGMLERAKVEMADILLGYNSSGDTANISPQVKQTACIRSGLYDARLELKEAQLHLSKTIIKSPINGRIVDFEVQPNNPTSIYNKVCRIIDESSLRVRFGIMETELEWAQVGTEVQVSPLSSSGIKVIGHIAEVNRIVDKTGMVSVVASLPKTQHLIPGMNVKLCIRKAIPNALVIPIEALTQRQNRDVVFVMSDSLAIWKYVEVGPRNITEVVITDGLKPGEKVIVKGNATIGHEAWVKELISE
ncbi:efflux RND transporter periplasmic adaptor subunit [Tenuifilum thalassicum]|uniref:Efflux RND transporter periplasmic adaptor subunit n=1 Tax=Tenuifilum thalassicum TaxID=2590900 RepID=A0A7D3XTW2_9BACT|nr:efflux RND transporter periplasmic adaptor subunit [Tenuifilum thalassicum]QKG79191.1 efflux RND transporter periplasmic adaptor subunit [Tenuifilum thalassicum]